jgi:tetratricopeptide (TPR) repeat protein
MQSNFNQLADEWMAQGWYAEAEDLLEKAIAEMPASWSPKIVEGGLVRIAFWNAQEFLAHNAHESQAGKSTSWESTSYSRAWYQLAQIAVARNQPERALRCLDRGIQLEPDHPDLWNEKGAVLAKLEQHQEAWECYVRAAATRDWAMPSQVATALRGQGTQLVDLNRLPEAQAALLRSLELEPDDESALIELNYVKDMWRSGAKTRPEYPSAIQRLLDPPKDPLTQQLVALVADLEPLPGALTVGEANMSMISEAFLGGGWEAFEVAFDQAIPRSRPDYAEVKRNLLRDPKFSFKTLKALADLMTGKKTILDILDELGMEPGANVTLQ